MRVLLNLTTKILRQKFVRVDYLQTSSYATHKMGSKMIPVKNIVPNGEGEHSDAGADGNQEISKYQSKLRSNLSVKKIDTPEFRGIFTDELKTLIKLFEKFNYELRIAGGAVRDILMSIPPKDIDLATTATPEEMKSMFGKEEVRMINMNGEKHGTITARIADKENFEITTLRIDIATDGRHAQVLFTKDWQLDANRRDLTINSMFLGFDGTLYDYFNGCEDLVQRRVAFVGDAATRIREDYLRILRYFRFYGRIANEPNKHDEETLRAIKQNIQGLERITGERIWTELQKIVVGNYSHELVLRMLECGMAPYIGLPTQPYLSEFERFCKTSATFEQKPPAITYMTALLNDVEDVMCLHRRVRLRNIERDLALYIIQHRDKVDVEYKKLLDYQKLCMMPYAKRAFVEELLRYCGKNELYQAMKECELPEFPINGLALKQRSGLEGAFLGNVLKELKVIWSNANFLMSREELLDVHLPVTIEKFTKKTSSRKRQKKNVMNEKSN